MLSQILKYPFTVSDRVEIPMPRDAEILAVQVQHGTPCLWARVDPTEVQVPRKFRVFETDQPLPPGWDGQYIGTVQLLEGAQVWHVYEDED